MSKTLFERCLELTGTFETSKLPPESYGVTVGNFDGAGMSFGVLQFNLLSGTLQPILREMIAKHPDIVKSCFGSLYPELQEMLDTRSTKAQIEWAKKRTINCRPLRPEWRDAFRRLGITPECIAIQRQAAKERYYTKAVTLFKEYGLQSERGFALMFDIATQNGGIYEATKKLILTDFAKLKGLSPEAAEVERMKIIATRRAEAANKKWVSDVKNRKMTIALGFGTVHGVKVNLETDFDITLRKAVI